MLAGAKNASDEIANPVTLECITIIRAYSRNEILNLTSTIAVGSVDLCA
jgi:hypothetical protein